MGLTSAMYIGLSGLNANQTRIDTIGNNIANVNTTAFKGSRTLLQTSFSQLLSAGHGPRAETGGVNPTQLGLGAVVGATQKNFNPGAVETTGIPSDLAVEGDGFFILERSPGETVYTRDGSFSVDSGSRLVSIDGYPVQGFGVDENFELVPGVLTDLTVPLGTLTDARPTDTAQLDGDLSADGTIATQGSVHQSQGLVTGGGAPADAGTALTDLRSANDPGVALFVDGAELTLAAATRGDRAVADATFVVGTDGSTLGDLAAWLEDKLGIQTEQGLAGAPGITIENGALVIRGNAGEQNALGLTNASLTSTTPGVGLPFNFSQTQEANGSSVFTSFTVYDSLGTPVVLNATFALEQTPDSGPVWRFFIDSSESQGADRALATGTITFDTEGNFVSATGNDVQVDLSGTGAATPLQVTLDFTGLHGLSSEASNVILGSQNGFPPGTLTSYGIGPDGTINGNFSNGLTKTLGQVALAVIPNPGGLLAENDNLYTLGPNTGAPTVTAPGTFGAGSVLAGALELSNVDLSREFIGLITSSTGFQASSRVISTSSQMLDQLLLIVR